MHRLDAPDAELYTLCCSDVAKKPGTEPEIARRARRLDWQRYAEHGLRRNLLGSQGGHVVRQASTPLGEN